MVIILIGSIDFPIDKITIKRFRTMAAYKGQSGLFLINTKTKEQALYFVGDSTFDIRDLSEAYIALRERHRAEHMCTKIVQCDYPKIYIEWFIWTLVITVIVIILVIIFLNFINILK